MRIVLQRVSKASVMVNDKIVGDIGRGYVILLGVSGGDNTTVVERFVEKISKLRIFPDENGKTNLSIDEINGEILIVSQFTLYADCKKGNRPSFTEAGGVELANSLYEHFIKSCEGKFKKTAHGVFGENMSVSLTNDGPFTLVLESDKLFN